MIPPGEYMFCKSEADFFCSVLVVENMWLKNYDTIFGLCIDRLYKNEFLMDMCEWRGSVFYFKVCLHLKIFSKQ